MINKYDKFVEKDFSWKTYIPQLPELDVEQLDKLLAGQQAKIDNLEQVKTLIPNALQTPEDLALQKQVKNLVDSGSQQVSEAFLKSPSAGNLAYKNYINQVKKAYQPGGAADVLNKRYQGYAESKKTIDDYYKDEVNPVFKQYAYDQLQQQVLAGPKYNPNTGEFQTVQSPELFKNPNLRKAILETAKQIEESGDTQFLGNTNKDWWIQKIQSTGKSEEKLRLIAQALMEQPEFANELKVEQWYQGRNGQDEKITEGFKKGMQNQLTGLTSQAKDAQLGKGTKEWQEFLVDQGYDVSPDGRYGDKTRKATEDFLEKQKTVLDTNLASPNIKETAVRKQIEKSYLDYAAGLSNKKISKELIFNKQREVLMKDARDKERTKALLQLNDRLAPVVDPDILVTPQSAVNLTSSFELLKETKANKEAFEKGATKTLTQNPNSVFNGWTMANVAEAQRLYNEVPTTLEGRHLTEVERQQMFNDKLRENSSFGFTPEQVTSIYNGIKTDTGVNSTFEQLAAMDHAEEMLTAHTEQVATAYVDTQEGKKAISNLRSSIQDPSLKSLSDTQLAQEALVNPERFVKTFVSGANPNSKVPSSVKSRDTAILSGEGQNPAEWYKKTMESDIPKLQKQGIDFKTENIWGIHAGDKDKFLRPVYNNINSALNSQVESTFASEGMSGLVLRDMKGEVVDGKPIFKDGYVSVGPDNKPVYRAVGQLPGKQGQPGKMVSTEINLNDGNPIAKTLERAMRKELAQNAATDNWTNVHAIAQNLFKFDTNNIITSRQEQEAPLKGVQPQAINIIDRDGTATTTEKLGFKTRKINTKNYGGVNYYTYVGQDKTGNKVFFNVSDVVDQSGNPTGARVVIPLNNGKNYTSDVSEINTFNLAGEIISQTPVEREVKKIPEGTIQAITEFQ